MVPKGCQIHHPLGFNWNPLEGAGISILSSNIFSARLGGRIFSFQHGDSGPKAANFSFDDPRAPR